MIGIERCRRRVRRVKTKNEFSISIDPEIARDVRIKLSDVRRPQVRGVMEVVVGGRHFGSWVFYWRREFKRTKDCDCPPKGLYAVTRMKDFQDLQGLQVMVMGKVLWTWMEGCRG